MKVLVSACLLGENCKYNGGNNYNQAVVDYLEGKQPVPVCPELRAGLGCPRMPIELVDGVMTCRDGTCVDLPVRRAIREILDEYRNQDIHCAILQSRSPTCGVKQVYDGSFSGRLIPGSGAFAQALMEAGYTVIDAAEVPLKSE